MGNFTVLFASLLVLATCCRNLMALPQVPNESAERPHIIIILADDWGKKLWYFETKLKYGEEIVSRSKRVE